MPEREYLSIRNKEVMCNDVCGDPLIHAPEEESNAVKLQRRGEENDIRIHTVYVCTAPEAPLVYGETKRIPENCRTCLFHTKPFDELHPHQESRPIPEDHSLFGFGEVELGISIPAEYDDPQFRANPLNNSEEE